MLFFDAFTRIGPRPRTHGRHPWSLEHLLDELQHCSVSGALVASTGQTLYDAMLENRRLSERLAPYDHLFPIWHVLPHHTDECPPPAELTALLQQHDVRAVSISPSVNAWNLRSPLNRPLLEELERTRTLTIVTMEVDLTFDEVEFLAQQFPDLPVLMTGALWGRQRHVLPLLLEYKNLHVAFDKLQINYGIEWLVDRGCEDQLLFASRAPEMAAGAHRFYVDYAMVDEAVRQKIASGNLTRLLKGQAPPREVHNRDEDEIMAEARVGTPISSLVIDMHAHILDEGLNGAGAAYVMFNGGPRGTIRLAERMGVDAIGVMSWNGTVGVHAEEGNQCVKAALDAAPESWWGMGTFDVMHETPERMRTQMEALYEDRRFLGIKPYPQYGIDYDDPRYDCWWQFANERHMYVGVHPHSWYQPRELESLCERFPDMTVVAYHAGGSYEIADAVIGVGKKYSNLMAEPTLTPVCTGIIDYLVEGLGPDRVMYGSDLPMRDPRQQLGWIVYSKLDVETKKKVLGLNAQRLLQRIRERQGQVAGVR